MMTDTLGILTRTVEPTAEPVSLEELTAQVASTDTAEDLLLWRCAQRARADLEQRFRVAFLSQTWTWKLDELPEYGPLCIPWLPVTSVSSIAYVDDAGTTQTWSSSDYQVSYATQRRTRIAPAYDESWPSLRGSTFAAMTVTFVAGWASAAAVPLPLKQAVLMYAAFLYANRGDTTSGGAVTVSVSSRESIPPAVESLMGSYGLELYV